MTKDSSSELREILGFTPDYDFIMIEKENGSKVVYWRDIEACLARDRQRWLDTPTKHLVKDTINSLETITYYKHHYVRKAGLKRAIKELLAHDRQELLKRIELPEMKKIAAIPNMYPAPESFSQGYGRGEFTGYNQAIKDCQAILKQLKEEI